MFKRKLLPLMTACALSSLSLTANASFSTEMPTPTPLELRIQQSKAEIISTAPQFIRELQANSLLIQKGSENAPILLEFFNFDCVYCHDAWANLMPVTKEKDWDVQFFVRPIQTSFSASMLATFALEQVPLEKRITYIDKMYEANKGLLGFRRFNEEAVNKVLAEFEINIEHNPALQIEYDKWITKHKLESEQVMKQGINGTPVFVLIDPKIFKEKETLTADDMQFFFSTFEMDKLIEAVKNYNKETHSDAAKADSEQ